MFSIVLYFVLFYSIVFSSILELSGHAVMHHFAKCFFSSFSYLFMFLTLIRSFFRNAGFFMLDFKHFETQTEIQDDISGPAALCHQLVELMQQLVVYEEPSKPQRRLQFSAFLRHSARSSAAPGASTDALLGGGLTPSRGSLEQEQRGAQR